MLQVSTVVQVPVLLLIPISLLLLLLY